MARIFLTLAGISLALMIANFVIGLNAGDVNDVSKAHRQASLELREANRNQLDSNSEAYKTIQLAATQARELHNTVKVRHRLHFLLGVAAALFVVLVNSISVTYFIGTSRWCKEVVDTYGLDEEFSNRSRRLKSKTFPWSISGVLVIITVAAFGGAADPGTSIETASDWVAPHYMAAIIGTCWIGYSFLMQVGLIGAHFDVIQEILSEVDDIRSNSKSDSSSYVHETDVDETPSQSENADGEQ